MKKIIALTALSAGLFAGSASALTLDVAVNWMQKTPAGAATGVSGTTTAGALSFDIANTSLSSPTNQPSYRVDFSISAPAAVSGYTFDHTEWDIGTRNQAGGSATSNNSAGSVIFDLYSATKSSVGTFLFGNNLINFAQSQALAGGSFLAGNGDAPQLANPTINLSTITKDYISGYFTNNALALFGLATATDTFTSDGNSASVFINYSQFAIAARNVYTQNPSTPIPAPGTLALVGLGLAGLGFRRSKQG